MAAQEEAAIVIIGGGAVGLSLAYHLGKLGQLDVLLLERNELTSGTSWHAAGIIGPLRASLNLSKLAIYATELFGPLEEETGQATGYRRTGGYWLAGNEDRMIELRRIAAMGDMVGLNVEIFSPDQVKARMPSLNTEDLAGALWVAEDGQANPVDLCMAYAKGARNAGVRIEEKCGVTGIERTGRRITAVTLADGRRIACGKLVNCAGVWSRQIGALAGAALPVQAAEHIYVVTEPVPDLPQPFPILRDLEGWTYIKEDAGKLVIGGFEPNAKPWQPESVAPDASFLMLPEDWEQAEPFLTTAMKRLPVLETLGLQTFMNGPEGFTPDTKQLMGRQPGFDNLYVAAGFNSIGIMSSAGVGKAMAEWVVDGEAPMDLWEVDVARLESPAANRAFLTARLPEAVHNQFQMHWPLKQMKTGRDLRRSALHDFWAAQGAVFGAPTGWERPLWFAKTAEEAEIRYSYGDQPWWPMAKREATALRDSVGLIELSPFGKFQVQGPGALASLQQLCANDIDVAPGRLVYTQMLNDRGGIEADLTVTRLSEREFWVVSGAPTRVKDLEWLENGVKEDAAVTDITSSYAVIGVMGPKSRDLMQSVSPNDFTNEFFPFGASQVIEIGCALLRASRVSYVGELGWELYIPVESAAHVFQKLQEASHSFGGRPVGLYTLNGCRLEKAFRHWGHDIGPDDTPLEAGLRFAVAFGKSGGFRGRDALLRQQEQGTSNHLQLFQVEGANPLLLHDEPVFRDGAFIGRTTSGDLGNRTGHSLCFATLKRQSCETLKDLRSGSFEIEIAGTRHPLTPLTRAPYDPDGARMRA